MRIVARGVVAVVVGALTVGLLMAQAQKALTPMKFALDFTIQGPQGIFLLANDKGYLQLR